ncbi:uncharacterized protein L199_007046 [Kwoniella botswanensis]|uniref:uncharacterized protein n=1 Tax=Kwoniella botswanensis TaxID=1268659 RepID=UPI00315C727C
MALPQASLEEKIQALKKSLAAKQGEIRYLGDGMEEQDIIIQKMEQVIEKKERVINAKDKTIEEKVIINTHKESVIESLRFSAKKRRNELSNANGYTPEARGGASNRK